MRHSGERIAARRSMIAPRRERIVSLRRGKAIWDMTSSKVNPLAPLDYHSHGLHAGGSEHASITFDFVRRPQRLVRIVGELDRRPAVRRHDLADQRDWLELAVDAGGSAADEV